MFFTALTSKNLACVPMIPPAQEEEERAALLLGFEDVISALFEQVLMRVFLPRPTIPPQAAVLGVHSNETCQRHNDPTLFLRRLR